MRLAWPVCCAILLTLTPGGALAQYGPGALLKDTAKDIVLDPTTYAPTGVSYTAHRLDWESSQIFFQRGHLEDNADFTISGLSHDTPISHTAGNGKILRLMLPILEMSVLNNTAVSVSERTLTHFYPNHRKLISVIGWAEKIAMAGYLSYKYSYSNFHQWQLNKQYATELGYQ